MTLLVLLPEFTPIFLDKSCSLLATRHPGLFVSVGIGELLKSLSLHFNFTTSPTVLHNCPEMHGVSHLVA